MTMASEATRADESPVWCVAPATGGKADLGYVIDVGSEICDG